MLNKNIICWLLWLYHTVFLCQKIREDKQAAPSISCFCLYTLQYNDCIFTLKWSLKHFQTLFLYSKIARLVRMLCENVHIFILKCLVVAWRFSRPVWCWFWLVEWVLNVLQCGCLWIHSEPTPSDPSSILVLDVGGVLSPPFLALTLEQV